MAGGLYIVRVARGNQPPATAKKQYVPPRSTRTRSTFVLDKGLKLIQKPYNRDDLLRAVRNALDTEKVS